MLKMLNKEYSFKGIILSEWGGILDRMESLMSGIHIELPGSGCFDDEILDAVEQNLLDIQVVDSMVLDILNFIDITKKNRVNGYQYDRTYNHKLAEKIAEESICLLNNEDDILPLDPNDKIAVIGNAQYPMIQVAGSSYVPVSIIDDPLFCMREVSPNFTGSNILHSEGYDRNTKEVRNELVYEALRTVMEAKAVVVFLGFDESQVSEYSDFESLELPANQVDLIDSIVQYNKNIIVVVNSPTCINMPWIDKVKAVVDAKIPGEAFGSAIANLLFGIVNPSGKLSCAYPGLFPFGHGLSYTRFEYSNIYMECDDDACLISFILENTGEVHGKEVVFLYAEINRSYKRLVGFCKPGLAPGEKKKVTFRVTRQDLSIYDKEKKCETIFSGDYTFHICASEQDVKLSITTYIEGDNPIERDLSIPEKRAEFQEVENRDSYTLDSTINELLDSPAGRRLYQWCYKRAKSRMGLDDANPVFALNLDMFHNTPLRKLVLLGNGTLTFKKAQGLVDICNGNPIRGVSKVLF
jgi:beta-glucosidase